MEEPVVNKISIEANFDGKEAISGLQKLTKSLKELKDLGVDVGFGNFSKNFKSVTDTVEDFTKIGNSSGFNKAIGKLKELQKIKPPQILEEKKSSYSNQKLGNAFGENRLDMILNNFKDMSGIISGISKKVFSPIISFLKSVGRIATYRVIRTIISTITKSLREGVNVVYEFSKEVNGDVAKSIDNIKNRIEIMKGSLGSMASELIVRLEPAIVRLSDFVTNLSNNLAEAFAYMNGKTTWYKAVSNANAYTDATDGATEATKRLTNAVFGFDQINKLNSKSSSISFIETAVTDKGKQTAETLKNLEKYAIGIGAAFAAWRITTFVGEIGAVATSVTVIGTFLGTLDVLNIVDGIKKIKDGTSDLNNVLTTVLSTVSLIALIGGLLTGNASWIAAAGVAGVGAEITKTTGIGKGNDSILGNIWNDIKQFGSDTLDFIKTPFGSLWDGVSNFGGRLSEGIKGLFKPPAFSFDGFATGGFPEDGLFYANHNELIGQFSNGKTAVANNDQIVEGIKEGVYEAQSEQNNILRKQNELLQSILYKTGGEISITNIQRAMVRENRRAGKVIYPVW